MQTIALPDALDAMQRNIKLFLDIATGGKSGTVNVKVDAYTGTASIRHYKRPDGKVDVEVNFPALPSQHRLTKIELERWVSYFVHELCHAIYTDEAAWWTAVAERLHALVNGMEDVRIERAFNAAGTAGNSAELLTMLMRWAVAQSAVTAYDPNDMRQLPWTLAMFGRVRLCGYSIPAAARYEAMMSPATRKLVDWTMAQLDKAQSTGDVLEIARKIQKRLANGSKPVPGKAQGDGKPSTEATEAQGDGKPSTEATEAQGDGKPSTEATEAQGDGKPSTEATEAQGDGKPSTEATDGKPSKGKAQGNGDGKPGEPTGETVDLPQTDVTQCDAVDMQPLSDALRDAAKTLGRNAGHVEAAVIAAIRNAQETAGQPFSRLAATRGDDATLTDLHAIAARSGKLRAQVARVLKSEETETWERARPTGRLDRFAYARAASGDNSVFAKRTIAGGYQTEIEVLCDGSASMRGRPAYATATLALVIAQAAKQVGVKCGISRFTEGKPLAVKRPNETLSDGEVRKRLARLANVPSGMTDLTGAIVQASAKLAARAPGKRKLLFVVSDGDCAYGPEGVKSANAYARRLDVETAVLCIDTPAHKGFGLAVECDSRDVTKAGLNALVRALARE